MPIPCAGPRDITSCGHRTITRPPTAKPRTSPASGSRGGSAAAAELGAGRELRAAAGALACDPVLRVRIETLDLIDATQLVLRLIGRDVGLRGGRFLGEVERVVLSHAARGVPADLGADPDAAARALVELRLDLLDGFLERVVPLRAAEDVLHVLAGLAGGPEAAAADQAVESLCDLRAHAERARVERRAIAIAALVAMELELVAGVVAVVGVVTGKGNRAHDARIYNEMPRRNRPCAPGVGRGMG